ncbi:MAG: aminodeoxychorismate synthase component I [Alphaproteobacteria bacterium]
MTAPLIPIDHADPVAAFRALAGEPWAMLLHSAAADPLRGRYSYAVAEPVATLESVDGAVRQDGRPVPGDPFAALSAMLAGSPSVRPGGPAPFAGGAVGFIGYEAGRHLERLPARHGNPERQPEMAFGLYDAVAVYDHAAGRAWVQAARPAAEGKARRLAARLSALPVRPGGLPPVVWRGELRRDEYLDRVAAILDYIRAGDIYQANFTQRFLADRPSGFDAYALFERLCAGNPAPFAAYLNCGPALQIASASPERFLAVSAEGRIETRPIKGTAARQPDPAADAAAAAALAASAKDRAENLMIVDLMRNDLGRVARIGSVHVPALFAVESFATVHHLVSSVAARLRPGLGPVDLLRAAFPGGSITGAPKLRAMEIIDELETSRRGAYCGSVAWIGFDGAMDSSIVIRTVSATSAHLHAQAGGGIVADSDPAAEHAEMMVKVAPLLRAAGEAEQ